MPIYYPDILEQRFEPRTFTYGDKDVMLYALGVGMGRDPMDEAELAFVYEKDLKVIPMAATVLSSAGVTSASLVRTVTGWIPVSQVRMVTTGPLVSVGPLARSAFRRFGVG